MVYDVNQPQTLHSLKKWWHEFQDKAPVPDEEASAYCCVVVGNKVDLAEDLGNGQRRMAVSEQEALSFLEYLIPPSQSEHSITSPATIRPTPNALQENGRASPSGGPTSEETAPINGVALPPDEHDDDDDSETISGHKPIDIRFSARGHRSLSRATSRSRFGGTMTTTHTGLSVYYTPASSLYDEYVSAPSSPLGSPGHNTYRRRPTSSISSSSDTVTPSLFIRPGSPANLSARPPMDRGPKHFLASAKSGESVPTIFEYIAKRVVLRWEWEEAMRDRILDYTEQQTEIQMVRLSSEQGKSNSWTKHCCS